MFSITENFLNVNGFIETFLNNFLWGYSMSVYDYIKLLCEEKGLPIKEVETACGLSNGTISKWKASVPKADILHRISLFFGEPIVLKKPRTKNSNLNCG